LLFPEVGAGGKLAPGDAICGGARRQMALGGGGKSLKEVVLVVLCEKVLEEEEHYNVVDSLMREDFRLVNLRQTWLSTKQATELAGALGHRSPSALSLLFSSVVFEGATIVGADEGRGGGAGGRVVGGCASAWRGAMGGGELHSSLLFLPYHPHQTRHDCSLKLERRAAGRSKTKGAKAPASCLPWSATAASRACRSAL